LRLGIDNVGNCSFFERTILNNKVSVLIDPQVGKCAVTQEHGQLRALPLLKEIGIRNFTFVDTWKKYDLVDFNYLKFGDKIIQSSVFPICQFINQETELMSGLDTTERLLEYVLSSSNLHLVLVLDSSSFRLKNNQDGKPMIEDWDLSLSSFDYITLFANFLKNSEKEPAISLTQTTNLVFHEMADTYLEVFGERPKRLSDLFRFDRLPYDSYGWKILASLANREAQLECDTYVYNCFRSWVETDITRIVDYVVEGLQICSFDACKIEVQRKKRKTEVRN
jgi:hypothetical protein